MRFLREIPELAGRRVTVMGLGLLGGGVGVSRFLASKGARVTVTDLRGERELQESIDALAGLPITYHLEGHPDEDLTGADLVVVNPGVPRESPHLAKAVAAGVPLESEMNLFWKLCRAPIVGITGSNGKTTTTALIGEMLSASRSNVWVGGNIGVSLLEQVDRIQPDHIVVLEVSSFQLENLAFLERSPRVAVVTNLSPNHLDRHGTMEAYAEAKRNILRFQRPGDTAVLNAEDAVVSGWATSCAGQVLKFSRRRAVEAGAYVNGAGEVLVRYGCEETTIGPASELRLPGWFNLENLLAAACAAWACGARADAVRRVMREFRGVEHRLELVAEVGGVKFYNDSIATNPDSVIAALQVLPGPIVLLLGGSDKGVPFDRMAREMAGRVRRAVTLGVTAPKIEAAIERECPSVPFERAGSFEEAVERAVAAAAPGDTVLLSPACASFDMFRNYAERGRRFKEIVARLGSRAALPGPLP